VSLLAVPVGLVDRTAGEDPDAGHEAGLRIALHEQDLQAALGVFAAASQEDHSGGGPRDRRGLVLIAQRSATRLGHVGHLSTLISTSTSREPTRYPAQPNGS
jgi:hypothetical protein